MRTWCLLWLAILLAVVLAIPLIDRSNTSSHGPQTNQGQESPFLPVPAQSGHSRP
ncbi:hypothetical protein ACQKGC_24310 [Allorhizobium pseudoryzae]|jgi:uncharacterized iron-regulated membrane protein|uniref:hypothetical protein n=1 Tax=Allorhizobium pseudoryzae TaxID=379684 RepID=UPI0013EA8E0E|nr:hypothetical protein [Allorhizobium pseudoryzae]